MTAMDIVDLCIIHDDEVLMSCTLLDQIFVTTRTYAYTYTWVSLMSWLARYVRTYVS